MRTVVLRKTSQILAALLLLSALLPPLALASATIQNSTYDGSNVQGSVYSDTYHSGGLTVNVYQPDGTTWITSVTATYAVYDGTYKYNFNGAVSGPFKAVKLQTVEESSNVFDAVYDEDAPVWAPGSLLTASGTTDTAVTLSWPAATDAKSGLASYNVYKDNSLLANGVTQTTYAVSGLTAATTYAFRVEAVDAVGNTTSIGDSLQKSVSTNGASGGGGNILPTWTGGTLSITASTPYSITLAWPAATDSDGTIAGYVLEDNGTTLGTVTGTTYTVTGLLPETSHTFKVWAKDNSDALTTDPLEVTGSTPSVSAYETDAPVWPLNAALTYSVTKNSASLTWPAATDASLVSYAVYQDTTKLTTVTSVTYTVYNLNVNTSYAFSVYALDEYGNVNGTPLSVSLRTKSSDDSGSPANTGSGGGGGGSSSSGSGSQVTAAADGTVSASSLQSAFAAASAIEISISGDRATLPASALADAAGKAGASVTIVSDKGTYTLPLSVLNLGTLAAALGVDMKDLTVSVTISKASGETSTGIAGAANAAGVTPIADAIDFHVTVTTKDGKTATVDFGKTYVSRSMSVSKTVDPNKTTGVLFNEALKSFSFVPSLFETKDGITTATLKRNGNSVYTVVEVNKSFADLTGHWAKGDIELLANKLIVDGVTDTSFQADRNISRAEFAALVVRSLGLAPAAITTTFSDVPAGAWYNSVVSTAVYAGLINGYEDNTFRPDAQITREELSALVIRALNYAGVATDITAAQKETVLAKFKDADQIVWAQNELAAAVQAGILNGLTEDTIGSSSQATRAQAVTVLKRLLSSVHFIN